MSIKRGTPRVAPLLFPLLVLAFLHSCTTAPPPPAPPVPETEKTSPAEAGDLAVSDPQLEAGDDWRRWWSLNRDDILNLKPRILASGWATTTTS